MFFLSVLMKISFQIWFCLILQKLMTLKEKNLEKYGSWFSCLLIRKMSRKLIVGSQVPLSLQHFSLTKENLKVFYNLEGIQWRPWRRFDQFYEVFSPDNKKKKERKKKKKEKKKTKTLNPWIDLVNLRVLFLRNSKERDFLCDCSNGVCLSNVLKNMFHDRTDNSCTVSTSRCSIQSLRKVF